MRRTTRMRCGGETTGGPAVLFESRRGENRPGWNKPGWAAYISLRVQNLDPLAQAQFLEITIFLSQYLLSSQGDRVAMAHSVEGRFPFLDYRLVELCSRMPDRLKLRGLKDKYLLRQVAAKYLPPEIARRAKRPYRAPIQRSLFSKAASDYVRDLTRLLSSALPGSLNRRRLGS